eukprot:gene11868-8156_t
MSFEQLGVEGWLSRQCTSLALYQPTPIQTQCIPRILAGRHVLGGAATGSGKTAAFALPMLQILSQELYGVFAVVLTPSRELGYQLADQFIAFGAPMRLRTVLIMGGTSHNDQLEAVKARPHLLIATPGRLCFLFRTFQAEMAQALQFLRFLVLDEADRLTDAELGKDVRWLVTHHLRPTPRRQVLLFSATLHPRLTNFTSGAGDEGKESWPLLLGIPRPDALDVFAISSDVEEGREGMAEEESKRTKKGQGNDADAQPSPSSPSAEVSPFRIPPTLRNRYLFIPNVVKLPYLVATLRALGKEQMTIVFVNSCMRAELVRLVLQLLGFPVCSLHSLLRQQQRLDHLAMFKLGIAKILVATDIASRGLDIPTVGVVLHYDVPKQTEAFVHRVGRTARAGRDGLSVAFITECDVRLVKQVERQLGGRKLTAWTQEDGTPVVHTSFVDAGEETAASETNNKKKKKPSSSSSTATAQAGKAAAPDAPRIAEEEVVKILDEVSEAKVQALQQVTEKFGRRAETLKQQAHDKKSAWREQQQQQQRQRLRSASVPEAPAEKQKMKSRSPSVTTPVKKKMKTISRDPSMGASTPFIERGSLESSGVNPQLKRKRNKDGKTKATAPKI